jgi:hypothetical protein
MKNEPIEKKTLLNTSTNIPEMLHQFISFISNQRQIFPYKTCKSLLLSRFVTDIGVGILLVLLAHIVNIKFIILWFFVVWFVTILIFGHLMITQWSWYSLTKTQENSWKISWKLCVFLRNLRRQFIRWFIIECTLNNSTCINIFIYLCSLYINFKNIFHQYWGA